MKTANLAIVFSDLKGFTERTSRQTLEQNQALLLTHHGLLTPIFRAFHGKVVKEIGDSFLVTFESPTQAVLAAVALQDRLWAHNRALGADERLQVRVGINAGEVRVDSGDVFGEPVNIAARVKELADAGDVHLTESVYLAMNKAEVPAVEVGSFELKGIVGMIRVFKVPRADRADDGAPYGNLGLAKMPEGGAAELTAKAAELTARAVHGGEALVKRAVEGVGTLDRTRSLGLLRRAAPLLAGALGLLLLGLGLRWVSSSPLERAVRAVEQAAPAERNARIEQVLKLLAEEKDLATQQHWSGRLQQLRDDPNAVGHYKAAARLGHEASEDALIALLDHRRCQFRVAALAAVAELKLARARPKVAALAEHGGPGDEQKALFLGCSSKEEAAAALRALE